MSDLDAPCDARIRLAASLSTRFQSTLIGLAASQPPSPLTYGGVIVNPQPTPAMIHELSARLSGLGEHFNSVVGWNRQIEWRAGINSPTRFLAAEARAADLVIIGRDRVPGDFYRTLDPGAFTLRAGRPVLVVPPDAEVTAGGEHCGRLEGNAGGATSGSGCDAPAGQSEPRVRGGM